MAVVKNIERGFLEEDGWRVIVDPIPWDLDVQIWLIQKRGSDAFNATINDTGRLVLKKTDEKTPPPLMRLPQQIWQMIVDAIAETTPPRKKERVEAELEATKFHLEDLRALLKLK